MKNIVLFSLLAASYAMGSVNWMPSYNSALALAKKTNKNVMVVLSKKECQACEYMEEVVFSEKEVEAAINDDFVPVLIDVNKDKIPSTLSYFGTPTFYFLTPDGKQLSRHNGAENRQDFLKRLKTQATEK